MCSPPSTEMAKTAPAVDGVKIVKNKWKRKLERRRGRRGGVCRDGTKKVPLLCRESRMKGKRLAAGESSVGPEAAALRHCRTNDGGGRIEAKQIGWGGELEGTRELCIGAKGVEQKINGTKRE